MSVDTGELQRAWEAVPNYAVVQILNRRCKEVFTLWWRCEPYGKVFSDSGGWKAVRGADGRLAASWWSWKTCNTEVQDFVVIACDVTPDLDDAEIQRRCGWPAGLVAGEVSRVA